MNTFANIISATDLATHLSDVLLLDVRAKLGDSAWGYAEFLRGHLPGAQHIDLDRDLAAAPGSDGRHPLPERAAFVECLRQLGLNKHQQVVCYDDAGGPYAARAWWMLRWVGHAAVAVLDGGMSQWSGNLESGPADARAPGNFTADDALTRSASTAEVMASLGTDTVLVDARAEARWAGREEPIDAVAGHIPGAICLPFNGNLDSAGRFLPAAALAERFGSGADVICYCGSGVTAAHNALAMHIAGLPEPRLYVNSWSGWITDPARPIETAT